VTELVLEMVEGGDPGAQHRLEGPLEIGREPAGGGIRVTDEQVSRRHARISPAAGAATIEDLGSRNGTYVNGQIIGTAPRDLAPGDQIRMGLTVFELRSREQIAGRPSAVQPRPEITQLRAGVLVPAREDELGVAPEPQAPEAPALRAPDEEPAFVPSAVMNQARSTGARRADELASLVDKRVKRQTNVAAFALLTIAALAVAIYFGIR
jgi:pSer/pThr/pTyr-binding forkhead associated (FHA) protein